MQPLYYNPDEPQYRQSLSWTCSACSLAWVNRALGIQHATDEISAVNYIGEPENINSTYGLMDGSGTRLVQCLREQGAPALNGWWTFQQTYLLAGYMPLLIGGVAWNHWVGVRSSDVDVLQLANSAEGWGDVYATLEEEQWNERGPFAVVAVPLLRYFPPPPTT